MCPTKLLIIVIIKCLSLSEIMQFLFFIFCFYTFLFNHVNKYEKMLSSLLYLTLVTSCIIGPFLCCRPPIVLIITTNDGYKYFKKEKFENVILKGGFGEKLFHFFSYRKVKKFLSSIFTLNFWLKSLNRGFLNAKYTLP